VHSNSLQVENVTVRYHVGRTEQIALDDVSLVLQPGEFTLIMGPSGSGKTTLLSILGCLLTPDAGRITMLGQNVGNLRDAEKTEFRRNHVAFIFQAFRLLSALTALENVIVTLDIQGTRGHGARDLALKALTVVGLSEKKHLRPDQLSGGEKQRVAIARAIATNSPIILADEPTASLDAAAGRQVIELLAALAHGLDLFVVMVSHDYRWKHYAKRIVTLQDGKLAGDERITSGPLE
jgi:putative ABC transport system ATP-binding protein